jgi:hypothetical protein
MCLAFEGQKSDPRRYHQLNGSLIQVNGQIALETTSHTVYNIAQFFRFKVKEPQCCPEKEFNGWRPLEKVQL